MRGLFLGNQVGKHGYKAVDGIRALARRGGKFLRWQRIKSAKSHGVAVDEHQSFGGSHGVDPT